MTAETDGRKHESSGKNKQRRNFLKGLGVTGIATLAGCSGGNNGSGNSSTSSSTSSGGSTNSSTSSSGGSSSGSSDFVTTTSADVKNLDPTQISDTTSSKVFDTVYEALVAVDFDGKVQPVLAKSVDQKGDLSFRATLNQGVTFHDGSKFTADDVKASFDRYKGTPRESDVYDWYDSSSVVDDHTIDIKLSKKYAPFKTSLSGVPIVPKEAKSGSLDLTKKPIGTGPFQYVKHEPDKLFRIKRYDNYWQKDKLPKSGFPDTVTFRVITDQSEQLNALKSGDVDFINDPPATSIAKLKKNSKYTVTQHVAGGYDMLILPMHQKPFDNVNIRRGVLRLVPREAIVKSVYNGQAQPAYTPFSPLVKQYVSQSLRDEIKQKHAGYDQKKGTALLKKGFSEAGISKPYKTKIFANQNPQRVKWCQLIKESLEQTGYFKIEIQTFEWNTYLKKIDAADSASINAMIALGWSAGWDPDDYVHNLFTKKQYTPACCNINHYYNSKVDDLINQGLTTFDKSKRKDIYAKIAKILAQDVPMAFIEFQTASDAMNASRVKDWKTYPIDGGEYNPIAMPYADQYVKLNK